MSIGRWIDKEVVVHVHNGIVLSYKKECIWISSNEVDELRAYIEWSKSEDEMAGWHHWLDGCESEWTLGAGDGQGGLACCHSWGCKESDTTERLNWLKSETERQILYINAYIQNLERWYWWSYIQGSKGDTNRLLDSIGEEGGMIWENSVGTYTLPYVK